MDDSVFGESCGQILASMFLRLLLPDLAAVFTYISGSPSLPVL